MKASTAADDVERLQLLRKPCPTDQSIIMVAGNGENSIVSLCSCADALMADEAVSLAAAAGTQDWLLAQGNLTAETTLAALRTARGRVVLNTAPLRWPVDPLLPHCAILVANRIHARGCAAVVVTLGTEGCMWADPQGVFRVPAAAVRPVDTSGAGDTFCGVLVARLATGTPLNDAISDAQAAAAVSVTRRGAFESIPAADELR
jgi:ribokinase